MKTKNFNTLLGLAAALGILCFPLTAGAYSVPAPQQAAEAKAAVAGVLAPGSFGNYAGSGSNYAEEKVSLGPVNEKGLVLPARGRFEGVDCSDQTWFSKAPLKPCPPAGIRDSGYKTKEVPGLAGAGMKEKAEGGKQVTQRVKRVSRLQEPGEAMGGGREKHLKEDAKMLEAKNRVKLEAN